MLPKVSNLLVKSENCLTNISGNDKNEIRNQHWHANPK